MSISTIQTSRVSMNLQSSNLLAALRSNTLSLYTEQNRLSLGRQYVTPSEDPQSSARARNLSQILDQQSQIAENIRHASNTLDASDVAMADVNDLINDAYAVASQNLGELASSDERVAAAEIVASIREQLVAVGNRTFDGRYLFAGRDTDAQPFVGALGGIAYTGDTGDIFARTDLFELEEINLPGNVLFGALSSGVNGFVDLDPALTTDTRLEDLRGMRDSGINKGVFEIVPDGGAAIRIDISSADTIGDVVDTINTAATDAGANFVASLDEDGLVITPGGGAISIRDVSTGTTAADLGIVSATPSTAAIGGNDLGTALSRTTALADLLGGTGIDLSSGIQITNGDQSATVLFDGAETVQDVLNAINNSGTYVRAEINEARNGINIVNTVSGTSMTVGENGGDAATVLGVRSMHADSSLSELNHGQGVRTMDGAADLRITARDGSSFTVNLDGVSTVQDVIDAINDAATAAGVGVTADLAATGNGIQLADGSGGAGEFAVTRENYSYAADDLGIALRTSDPTATLIGEEVAGARAQGIITALYDLEKALMNDDSQGITIAAEDVDTYLQDFNRSRGVVGAQAAAMQDRLIQTEEASYSTEALLSEIEELDYTEAITKFQQAQMALQASLMTGSQVMSNSLLNYLG